LGCDSEQSERSLDVVALDRAVLDRPDLSFDNVRIGYKHYSKLIAAGRELALPRALLKWYEISFEGRSMPIELIEGAREFVVTEAEIGCLALDDELGFVILHDCGDIVFLIVSSWRGSNELWETVYQMDTFNGGEFTPVQSGSHRPTFCVWEMGAVWHETQAWSRYLYSPRGYSDREEWLADSYSGAI
jgi:hypothetical protein